MTNSTIAENSAKLAYTTSQINTNFRIKAKGYNEYKMNTLLGVSGLVNMIGTDLANSIIERAFNSMDDKTVCKLRRGIVITFYVK
ncbi:MAG: ribosomal large subunit pseudouridine synthase B [Bacteroidales bacterium]